MAGTMELPWAYNSAVQAGQHMEVSGTLGAECRATSEAGNGTKGSSWVSSWSQGCYKITMAQLIAAGKTLSL